MTLRIIKNDQQDPGSDLWAQAAPAISYLNEQHAFVLMNGKAVVIRETPGRGGLIEIQYMSPADFKLRYANHDVEIQIGDKTKHYSAGDLWLRWPQRRTFDGIDFAPDGKLPKDYYNLWRGFGVMPKAGSTDIFRRHLYEVICSENNAAFEYLWCWLAHLVQRPEEIPGVAVVLRGAQGAGKGSFVKPLSEIAGQHYAHLASAHSLTGRFLGHLSNSLLVFADEAVWGGDKAAEGTLKALITEPDLMIEDKYVRATQIRNVKRLIVASNNSWCVPLGHDDRRYLVLDVSDRYMQDPAHFQPYNDWLEADGAAALMHDLLQVDLSGFNVRARPETAAAAELKMLSAEPSVKFIYDWLLGHVSGLEEWTISVPKTVLFEAYIKYVKDTQRNGYAGTPEQFSKSVIAVIGATTSRPRTEGDRVYTWQLPDIADAQQRFAEYHRADAKALFSSDSSDSHVPGF